MSKKTGVLLVNLGTPSTPTAAGVRRFLREFLMDSRVIGIPMMIWWFILNLFILPFRPKKVAAKYAKVWHEGGSPLMVYNRGLTEGVQRYFQEHGHDIDVQLAMTYGEPAISTALLAFQAQEVERVIILPLYPQFSASTTGSVVDVVSATFRQWLNIPEYTVVSNYCDHPNYIFALASQIKQHWKVHPRADKLIFSFHGLPQVNVDRGDPYAVQCHKTATLVAELLGLEEDDWMSVFQSRFGAQTWLKPYCDKVMAELPKQGCQSVDVMCPGFAADCLETLEEINMENREIFLEAGGETFHYIPALNDSQVHIELITQLILDRINQESTSYQAVNEAAMA